MDDSKGAVPFFPFMARQVNQVENWRSHGSYCQFCLFRINEVVPMVGNIFSGDILKSNRYITI